MKNPIVGGILLAAVILLVTTVVTGNFNRTVQLPSTASVKAIKVGVYWDAAGTQPIASFNWGMLEPGQNITRDIYIQNQANVITTFFLNTANWIPTNTSTYISLTWSYDGHLVSINEIVPITLSLHVSPLIEGITNFSFDIVIGAQG